VPGYGLFVVAIVAALVATTSAPVLADSSFQESDTGGSESPDWLGPSSAAFESEADAQSASMSNSASARATTTVGVEVSAPGIGRFSAGRALANGFSQLSAFPVLAPGTYTARARFRVEALDLHLHVDEPAVPRVRSADAFAYLVISAESGSDFHFSLRELRENAQTSQDMTLVFRVDDSGTPVQVSCALGTVADDRGPAESSAKAAAVVEDFVIESTPEASAAVNAESQDDPRPKLFVPRTGAERLTR
jgi:hypothetical protein